MPENRLIRVMSALYCEPWLLSAEMHRLLSDIATAHASGGAAEQAQHQLAASFKANPKAKAFAMSGSTAVIPVDGVIGRKYSESLQSSGVTSIDVLERLVEMAAQDDEVDSMVLAIDSPGGLATGVPECAAAIAQARERKPVVALADGLCCSAAYWLASAADVIYAIPSARVGSIGVYSAIVDRSRQAEMEGLKVEVFRSGKHKGMGMPGTSLTDEQRAMIQADVDRLGAQFRAAVRAGRPGKTIADEAMQGASYDPGTSLHNGLIDGVANLGTAVADAQRLARMRKTQKGT